MTRSMRPARRLRSIVPGGGTALLYALRALDDLKGVNDDQTRGIDIVRKALQAPLRQIAQNGGHDGAVVAGRLIDGNDHNLGFNAQTEVYEDLVLAGVTTRPRSFVRRCRTPPRSRACSSPPKRLSPKGQKTTRRCPWAAAEWGAWAEWTSSKSKPLRYQTGPRLGFAVQPRACIVAISADRPRIATNLYVCGLRG